MKVAGSPRRNCVKPARAKAEKERLAKVTLRKYARMIPDNAKLAQILLQFPDKPFQRDFYYKLRPHLRFEPIPLEAINGQS